MQLAKTYRPLLCLLLVAAAAASLPAHAHHQTPLNPIAISNSGALSFGKFAAGTGGTVRVDPNGSRTSTGGVVLLSSGAGSAAQFTVSGDPLFTYRLTLPGNGSVSLTNSAGQSMALNNFTSNPSSGQFALDTLGRQTVKVAAELNVGPSQPAGSYSGSFTVFVDYD